MASPSLHFRSPCTTTTHLTNKALLSSVLIRSYRTEVKQIPGHKKKLRAKLNALKTPGVSAPNKTISILVPPVKPEGLTPVTYPYFVYRTPALNLPVYTDIRNGGTRPETIVRKVEGDIDAFQNELIPAVEENTREKVISRRSKGNVITLKGFHSTFVRQWLTEKGF